ncbi:acyltransferase family protein [Nocardioides caeni]|uniref:acyltransferase family protein n=1 Tax=Nocardioides caeni TaxID=574700 RepID=UPI0031E58279
MVDSTRPPPATGRRMDGMDGLRGGAALAIMIGHASLLLVGPVGAEAVVGKLTAILLQSLTLFFALSGFLLYGPWVAAIMRGRAAPQIPTYIRNRILRIYPAHTFVLIAAAIIGITVKTTDGPAPIGGHPSQFGHLTDPVTFLANLFLVQGWFPSTIFTGLGVSWSLITEFTFYLVLPFLGLLGVWLARRLPPLVAALLPPLLMLVACSISRYAYSSYVSGSGRSVEELHSGSTWAAVWYRSIAVQGDLIAFGMIAVVLVSAHAAVGDRRTAHTRRAAWAVLLAGLVGILATRGTDWISVATGVTCLGLLVVLRLPHPPRHVGAMVRVLESPLFRLTGEWSYSVYLWHFVVIWFFRLHVDAATYTTLGGWAVSMVMVCVPTLILGALGFRFIEAPAMRRKHSSTPAAEPARPADRP